MAPTPIEAKFINHGMVEMACVGGSFYPDTHCLTRFSEDTKEKVTSGGDATKAAVEKEIERHLKAVNGHLNKN